jgi:hypothetical protein
METTMNTQRVDTSANAISEDVLRAAVGDVDDATIIEILNLQPTIAELEEAVVWASGDGDVLAKSGHPLTGKVAQIVELLTAEEEEPPPVR